ncbi:MAG: glycerophosphodiester phosphodiesterase family protein, partial [bacterium]|nr:glycerophosphodiester phosphodiesterase family protein [bacterium]
VFMNKPICVAHRGFSGIAPENTLISFQKAIELEPDAFELDVHLSQDGELIVIHDDAVDRTTNGKGKVKEFTLAELKQLDAGSWFAQQYAGERIPTLTEALELARNKTRVMVELKAEGTADKSVQLIEQLDMIEQVIIFSFSSDLLKLAKRKNPNLSMLHLFWVNPKEKETLSPDTIINRTLSTSANLIGINGNAVTPRLVDTAHKRGLGLGVYTIDEENDMRALLELGVDGIVSNRIDRLLKVVR